MGLRVIGGQQRGRKLLTVKGMATRPTADRMRESLFNILADQVVGAHVLDLFAGTGALGLEALSRGAASAVFVDKEKIALSIIGKNIETCGFGEQSLVMKWNILLNLKCLESRVPPFDLVFMDPPYDTNCVRNTLINLHHSNAVKNGAIIIVEHSPMEPVPQDLLEFQIIDKRKYGRTFFSFLHFRLVTEKERFI